MDTGQVFISKLLTTALPEGPMDLALTFSSSKEEGSVKMEDSSSKELKADETLLLLS